MFGFRSLGLLLCQGTRTACTKVATSPLTPSTSSWSVPVSLQQRLGLVSSSVCTCDPAGTLPGPSSPSSHSAQPALNFQQQRQVFGFGPSAGELTKHYHERRLLGWPREQLFEVVADVDKYCEFVPWCQKSKVLIRKPDYVEAELEVGFKLFVERYTSQVWLTPPCKVLSKVTDSTLFDHLDTTWDFKPGPSPDLTWLTFNIDFAFKSALYQHVASVFFDEVVKRMMSAFEQRCRQLHGPSMLEKRANVRAHAGT